MNRLGFIGGSDATRIMTGNWYDLWAEKTGRKEPEDLSNNLAVQLGTHTESFHLEWFCKQTEKLNSGSKTYTIVENNVPYKGTVDGRTWDSKSITKLPAVIAPDAVIECKHTNSFTNMKEQIVRYMPQLQFYMHISDYKTAYLSCIFGNSQWDYRKVSYDEEYVHHMNATIRTFWDCVEDDTAPTDQAVIDTTHMTDKILIDDMVRRDANADNHFISIAHDFINTMEDAKSHQAYGKMLKDLVAKNESEVYSDILTIKRDKRGSLRITPSKKEN